MQSMESTRPGALARAPRVPDVASWPGPPRLKVAAAPSEPFLFVVDDDPVYCAMIRRKAESLGFVVACFHPDRDFDRLPRDGDFDVGVIDYDLGALKGTQVSALYFETPVLLVSGRHRPEAEEDAWPQSVRTFMAKDEGTTAVLAAALSLSRTRRL